MFKPLPQVALIGRPNVGKSTLFNKLTETKKAIVSNIPGTTRDRNFHTVEWNGLLFELVDTGGITTSRDGDHLVKDIAIQATKAVEHADLVLFMIDVRSVITKDDEIILKILKRARKNTIVVANKADTKKLKDQSIEYVSLGFGDPFPVSASNGSGTGDLLDEVVTILKKTKTKKQKFVPKGEIKIGIIGRPNVGKSTLVNAIMNDSMRITSSTPHTTRDAATLRWSYGGYLFAITDTAGIRRGNKARAFAEKIEKHSRSQALETMNHSDVVFLMVDISERISFQDKHLIAEAERAHCGIILVGNKWDCIKEKNTKTTQVYMKEMAKDFPFINWVPKLFVSALTHQRVTTLLDKAIDIYEKRSKTVPQKELDAFLERIIERHKPSRGGGTKYPKLYKLEQTSSAPPRFTLYMDKGSELHASYIVYIEKALRNDFDFEGSSISVDLVAVYKQDLH